jgi:hypothetical protein
MPWVTLDDQIASHPKIVKAGPEAAWMWACAIAYCQNHLTDGEVPLEALVTFGGFKHHRAVAERLVEARVRPAGAGLFERRDGGYAVHDYLKHNSSAETVLAARAKESARKATWRKQWNGEGRR